MSARVHLLRSAAIVVSIALTVIAPLALSACGRPDLSTRLDRYLSEQERLGSLSASVLVARGDQILLAKGYGNANYEQSLANTPVTKHRICSISKVFTGAAIMRLVESGRLSLADPVNRFLPGFPNGDRITVDHLVQHTSGLFDLHNDAAAPAGDWLSERTLTELIDRFRDRPLKFEPGTQVSYCNSGYVLLAAIIEQVSGVSYGDFLQQVIFSPLGMDDTGEYVNQPLDGLAAAYLGGSKPHLTEPYHWSNMRGSGNIYSTTGDLLTWSRALASGDVLSQSSLAALGNALTAYGHAEGISSGMLRRPSRGLTVIVLGNFHQSAEPVCQELLTMVLRDEEVKPVAGELAEYSGRYRMADGAEFELTVFDGTLCLRAGGAPAAPLMMLSGGDFLLDGQIMSFTRDDTGVVTGIIAPDMAGIPGIEPAVRIR